MNSEQKQGGISNEKKRKEFWTILLTLCLLIGMSDNAVLFVRKNITAKRVSAAASFSFTASAKSFGSIWGWGTNIVNDGVPGIPVGDKTSVTVNQLGTYNQLACPVSY